MIKVENTYIYNIYPAIRSIRNALKSWNKSDTKQLSYEENHVEDTVIWESFNYGIIGPRDIELAKRLIARGGDERKFLRTIHVNCDITTTRAHWTEIDTYKVGTVRNSTSTMHSILLKDLTKEDFEHDIPEVDLNFFNNTIANIKLLKKKGRDTRKILAMLKHSLPEGYLMMANFDTNYEQLLSMYNKRKNHFFLDWEPINKWCESLPYFMEFYSAFNTKN